MTAAGQLALVTALYVAALFAAASYADRRRKAGRSLLRHAPVYVLSLAIWHTSWTFYGNVGRVATVGIDFVAIYLGSSLAIASGWLLLRRMIRICRQENLVSIADFLASRYGKSTLLGALVAVLTVFCMVPYVALQLKAVADSFELLTRPAGAGTVEVESALAATLILAGFAILFGTRSLDPSARHEGLVVAVALESLVKLVAMLAVGGFVTFGLFKGPADLFARFADAFPGRRDLLLLGTEATPFSAWFALGLLCALVFVCLPHLFHVLVVENADEEHLRSAMWGFPLYMLLINLFIIPVALGGLLSSGGDTGSAEYFTVLLPLKHGRPWLAVLVFLGGFSASAGMVMVTAVALSTLVLNQLVMPLLLLWQIRAADISGVLLMIKRAAILAVMLLSYLFYRVIGESASLVNIGIITFVGAAQFAPGVLAALYWPRANRRGVLAGLALGCAAWLHTLVLPSLVRAGWLAREILEAGPFGLGLLRPEALFGLEGLPALPHALFWSLALNVGALLFVSHLTEQTAVEREQVRLFAGIPASSDVGEHRKRLSGAPSVVEFVELMGKFIGEKRAHEAITDYLGDKEIGSRGSLAEGELERLKGFVERSLSGSVGAAPARIIVENYLASRGSHMEEVFDIFGSVTLSGRAGREQLAVLHEAARRVAGGGDLQGVFDSILELLQQQFRFDLCVIRLLDPERSVLVVRSRRGEGAESLGEADRAPDMETYVGEAFLGNVPVVVNDTDFLDKALPAQIMHREGVKSFAHAPITIEGEPVGVLSAFSLSTKGIFSEEFMELFASLAGQVGVAWRNARQTERLLTARERELELEIARDIQIGLLPGAVPEVYGAALAGVCLPAREVGGDYYDFLPRGEAGVDLVVADVSGHNVGSALIMAEVRTFIRARGAAPGGAATVLRELNAFCYGDLDRTELFITMFYAHYDGSSGTLAYASAGHNPPLLWRRETASWQRLDAEGLILGIRPEVDFEEKRVQLQAGDVLLLYTDGVTEAVGTEATLFGEERLGALLEEHHVLPPAQLIETVLEQVRLFTGQSSFDDDLTLVALCMEG